MANITVAPQKEDLYLVTVREGASSTTHKVTLTPQHLARYAAPGTSPEKLLHASFQFLLQHEPKESILPSFELPLIEHYFPQYPTQIRKLL